MNSIFAVLIAVALFGVNALLYVLNKKTPVPEGCEDLTPDCAGCGIMDCAMRRKKEEE